MSRIKKTVRARSRNRFFILILRKLINGGIRGVYENSFSKMSFFLALAYSDPDHQSFILSAIRCFLRSTLMIFTFTISPTETTSIGFLIYLSVIREICTSPS